MAVAAPVAIAVAMWSSVAAATVATYAQIERAKTAKALARRNAQIANQAAVDARNRGDAAELRRRRRIHALLGAQTAAAGASGAQIESGSVLRLQEDAVTLGEMDVLTIRNNANREAQGLTTQAQSFLYEGAIEARAARFGAVNAGLAGASQAVGLSALRPSSPTPTIPNSFLGIPSTTGGN